MALLPFTENCAFFINQWCSSVFLCGAALRNLYPTLDIRSVRVHVYSHASPSLFSPTKRSIGLWSEWSYIVARMTQLFESMFDTGEWYMLDGRSHVWILTRLAAVTWRHCVALIWQNLYILTRPIMYA